MKNMKEYIGMNFKEWCSLDENDDRKINYKLNRSDIDCCEYFTSEEYMDFDYLYILQHSTIVDIFIKNNA